MQFLCKKEEEKNNNLTDYKRYICLLYTSDAADEEDSVDISAVMT